MPHQKIKRATNHHRRPDALSALDIHTMISYQYFMALCAISLIRSHQNAQSRSISQPRFLVCPIKFPLSHGIWAYPSPSLLVEFSPSVHAPLHSTFFILASVWVNQYYYVFGFVLLIFLTFILTATEINVLFNYFQLCGENYHWWWRSFITAGSTRICIFLYSFIYFGQLKANTIPTYMLYFGYVVRYLLVYSSC
jgi:hypothetical protein